MSFDTSVITEVSHSVSGGQLLLEWSSSAPAGSVYQVYVQGQHAWSGTTLHASVEIPSGGVNRVDVGAVGATERDTDFSSSLTIPANRARLAWTADVGGDTAGFRVYGEALPGGGISYASPLATVAAVEQGVATGGYGAGGYGAPGYGSIAGSFGWTSPPLTTGTWNFAVRPYDRAGNEGTSATTSVVIAVPPRPPALDASVKRLSYTYSQATKKITLNWLASPG